MEKKERKTNIFALKNNASPSTPVLFRDLSIAEMKMSFTWEIRKSGLERVK